MKISLRDSKFARLLGILKRRGAITPEESLGLCVVHALSYFDKKSWDQRLDANRHLVYSKEKGISQSMKSVLYTSGFFEEIKFEYEDKIVPYLNSHSYFSLLRTR